MEERARGGTEEAPPGTPSSSPPRAPLRFAVLLGDPVGHSLSPAIHNAAFRALGLDAVYLACRVEAARLGDAVAGLGALGCLGANVTIPHKEAAVRLVDRLTPAAEAVGAVNTLAFADEEIVGDNTDAEGFALPLRPHAETLAGTEAVVLGAGGAARAAVYALLTAFEPGRVTVAARRTEQARRLVADLSPWAGPDALCALPLAEAGEAIRRSTLVVNATPVGMMPHSDTTPWAHADDLHPGHLVYDLVYAPEETRLLREAATRGATPLGGLGMLLGQAAAAFRRWTGLPMPLDAVRAALTAHPPSPIHPQSFG